MFLRSVKDKVSLESISDRIFGMQFLHIVRVNMLFCEQQYVPKLNYITLASQTDTAVYTEVDTTYFVDCNILCFGVIMWQMWKQ